MKDNLIKLLHKEGYSVKICSAVQAVKFLNSLKYYQYFVRLPYKSDNFSSLLTTKRELISVLKDDILNPEITFAYDNKTVFLLEMS